MLDHTLKATGNEIDGDNGTNQDEDTIQTEIQLRIFFLNHPGQKFTLEQVKESVPSKNIPKACNRMAESGWLGKNRINGDMYFSLWTTEKTLYDYLKLNAGKEYSITDLSNLGFTEKTAYRKCKNLFEDGKITRRAAGRHGRRWLYSIPTELDIRVVHFPTGTMLASINYLNQDLTINPIIDEENEKTVLLLKLPTNWDVVIHFFQRRNDGRRIAVNSSLSKQLEIGDVVLSEDDYLVVDMRCEGIIYSVIVDGNDEYNEIDEKERIFIKERCIQKIGRESISLQMDQSNQMLVISNEGEISTFLAGLGMINAENSYSLLSMFSEVEMIQIIPQGKRW